MRHLSRIAAALLALLALQASAVSRPVPKGLAGTIDRFVSAHAFSGDVLLVDHGHPVFEHAYGLADRADKRPVTAETRFQVGSVSKWFTTLAALKLADRGRLDLSAPLSHDLPGYPASVGDRVNLIQVLSNMSGIRDRLSTRYINRADVAAQRLSAAEAVRRYAQGPLVFAPGTRFDYAHTNWLLAQAVLERASGMPLERLLQTSVFGPAGLKDSGVTHGDFRHTPHHAVAYASPEPDAAVEVHVIPGYLVPTGTIYSTAGDLARLAHVVYETPWLSRDSMRALMTVHDTAEHYAIGGRVMQRELGGRRVTLAWEIGSMGGFKALLVHAVGDDRSLVVLNNANLDEDTLSAFADDVLEAWYARP